MHCSAVGDAGHSGSHWTFSPCLSVQSEITFTGKDSDGRLGEDRMCIIGRPVINYGAGGLENGRVCVCVWQVMFYTYDMWEGM